MKQKLAFIAAYCALTAISIAAAAQIVASGAF